MEQLAQRLEAGGGCGPELAALLRIAGQDWHTAISEGRDEADRERLFEEWQEANEVLNAHMLQWVANRCQQAA